MEIKNIFWDFDGVILDSMKVRDWGFRMIFKDFDNEKVEKLIDYHRENGGLSRYVKIRYFYENILKKEISDEKILEYAESFSVLMKKNLVDQKNLIQDAVNFLKSNFKNYNFHIVSGSDQKELRFLCSELNLSNYFISIHGSPTSKNTLVKDLILKHNYNIDETVLIGDSKNDHEAAVINEISFIGYNNNNLEGLGDFYIDNFKNQKILN